MVTVVKDGIFRTVTSDKANTLIEYKGYRELTAEEKKAREGVAKKADK